MITGISPAAMQHLVSHYWPGNVRELQNVIERACALASGSQLEASDIQLDSPRHRVFSSSAAASDRDRFLPDGLTLDQWEDEMIREALKRAGGNKSQAARLLGLSRNALRYRLSKIGIDDPDAE
jgi:DNA-binding NtrC family response regulator